MKFLSKLGFYVQKYPARISGYISAITLNAMKYWNHLDVGLIVPIAMLLIMMGEGSQRIEDKKTVEALYTDNDPHKQDDELITEIVKRLDEDKKEKKNGGTKRSRRRTGKATIARR